MHTLGGARQLQSPTADMQHVSSSAFTDAIEQFTRVALERHAIPHVSLRAMRGHASELCGPALRARLKPLTGSSTARKIVEQPASAPNPKRVRRWLETAAPHISMSFSPLKERGPPRP